MQACVLESVCACVRREAKVLLHKGSQGVCLSFPGSQWVLWMKNALFSWVPLNYFITKQVLFLYFRSLLGFQSENYFNPNQNILALRTRILSYIYMKIKEHPRKRGSEPCQAVCVQIFSLLEVGFLLCCPGCSQTHECDDPPALSFKAAGTLGVHPLSAFTLVFA